MTRSTKRLAAPPAQLLTRLREIRQAKKLSQQEVADRIGLSQQQVQRLETGAQELTVRLLPAFAEALGVSVADLLPEEWIFSGDMRDTYQAMKLLSPPDAKRLGEMARVLRETATPPYKHEE